MSSKTWDLNPGGSLLFSFNPSGILAFIIKVWARIQEMGNGKMICEDGRETGSRIRDLVEQRQESRIRERVRAERQFSNDTISPRSNQVIVLRRSTFLGKKSRHIGMGVNYHSYW